MTKATTPYPQLTIGAIDVGSPKQGNLGWGLATEQSGAPPKDHTFDDFIDYIGRRLTKGPVALGFECPLFVPVRHEVAALVNSRVGETVGDARARLGRA